MDMVWIGDVGIGGEEFPPARAAAEVAAREFPERIAGLDMDFGGVGGCAGRRNRGEARCRRRQRGKRFGWEEQIWRSGWPRGVDTGRVRRYVGERECGFRGRGEIW